ncbi:MAG: hypothetical protein MUC48_10720 [Leptolyngbya sp. Prado105]|nr:hypothetical protein [Leptolyngbya sp. Prado105]
MDRLQKTCLMGLISLPLGIGTIALGFLNTPVAFSCNDVDEKATVSTRLHCAQQRAQRQTPESLTAAINLLENVSTDDPYHDQSNRLIERWSLELIAKAEAEFQAGNLDKAISMVRALPQTAKIREWRAVWAKGESVMKTALTQVEKREWHQAFQTASQLRQLGNEYWATTQYDLLKQQIQSDRELRDFALRNPVEPKKKLKETDLNLPKAAKIARSTRPLWIPKADKPTPHPVSVAAQPPQPQIEPELPTVQPSPQVEIEPEPPMEVLEPIETVQPEIPVPEALPDRT